MLIPFLLMMIFFCTNNAKIAQVRSLNPSKWAIITFVSAIVGVFAASFLVVFILIYKNPAMKTLILNKDQQALNKLLIENMAANNFLYSALIMAGAFGGYLFIRYLIEKKPLSGQS